MSFIESSFRGIAALLDPMKVLRNYNAKFKQNLTKNVAMKLEDLRSDLQFDTITRQFRLSKR